MALCSCPVCVRDRVEARAIEDSSGHEWAQPGGTQPPYDATEQDILIRVFSEMLRQPTKDGGKKRAAGLKPPWWRDPNHEKAIFSHLSKWMKGELKDEDSGAHPLVHVAWRCLAIAYQETEGKVDPQNVVH